MSLQTFNKSVQTLQMNMFIFIKISNHITNPFHILSHLLSLTNKPTQGRELSTDSFGHIRYLLFN